MEQSGQASSSELLNKEESNSNVFENFLKLPDPVQVHVLAYCSFVTLMNITQTCKRLNSLVFSELSLAKRIMLKLGISNMPDDDMEILQTNDRRYRAVSINVSKPEPGPKQMKYLELKGSCIHDLHLNIWSSENIDVIDLVIQVLISCKNLEELLIYVHYSVAMEMDGNGAQKEKIVSLPKLKHLETATTSMLVCILSKVHLDVHGLVKLCVGQDEDFNYSEDLVNQLEEFIVQQHKLKCLKIYGEIPRALFPEHRLKDIKFRLENFSAGSFVCDGSERAENFFKIQRSSLKKVRIASFNGVEKFAQNRDKHLRLLHEVFSLPKLKCLKVHILQWKEETPSELSYINDMTRLLSSTANHSIECIYYKYKLEDIAGFIASHPNLKKLKSGQKKFVIDFPTEFLKIIELQYTIKEIDYKPAILPSDPQRAADDLLEFFNRLTEHLRNNVFSLTIGDASWIDRDLSLPLSFWKEVSPIFEDLTITAYNIKTSEIEFLSQIEHISHFEFYTKSRKFTFDRY